FCVDREATLLRVEARWGQYLREFKEEQNDARTGRPLRVWKRHPRGGFIGINLRGGALKPLAAAPECPDVLVRGYVRTRGHGWTVTLSRVTAQEMPLTKRDEAHLFHPVLSVTAPDGSPVFGKRTPEGRKARDREEALMSMLYRRHVGFAAGHGV